jgi:hypothetical protein
MFLLDFILEDWASSFLLLYIVHLAFRYEAF